jgi:hypothetical protein
MELMGLMGPLGLPEFIVLVLVLVYSGEFGDIFIRTLRLAVILRRWVSMASRTRTTTRTITVASPL